MDYLEQERLNRMTRTPGVTRATRVDDMSSDEDDVSVENGQIDAFRILPGHQGRELENEVLPHVRGPTASAVGYLFAWFSSVLASSTAKI